MRVMMLLKASKNSEAGVMPTTEMFTEMGKYNQSLIDAGKMIDGAGLQPSSKGAKIKFQGGKAQVTDGPFAETKELLAGFYLVEAPNIEEAIQIASKIPPAREGSIEVRPVRQLEV